MAPDSISFESSAEKLSRKGLLSWAGAIRSFVRLAGKLRIEILKNLLYLLSCVK